MADANNTLVQPTGQPGSPYLRDYTHASKTFRSNNYAYAPKFKWLYHVYFEINSAYIAQTATWPSDQNFGLTVKNIQLPKFSFDLHDMNQYNRKRVIQTKIKYDPIQITFHDDNADLMRQMWYSYYSYYYQDATHPDANTNISDLVTTFGQLTNSAYDYNVRNTYSNTALLNAPDWGYVGDTNLSLQSAASNALGYSKPPFFRAINVYSFNQHDFALYRLINPIIDSFSHDTHDYYQTSGTMENSMTLRYETVKYYEGALNGADPSSVVYDFGQSEHYDTVTSSITPAGGNQTVISVNGPVSAGRGGITDLTNGTYLGGIQQSILGSTTNAGQAALNALGVGAVGLIAGQALAQNPRGFFSFPSADTSGQQVQYGPPAPTALGPSSTSALGYGSDPFIG